MTHYLVFELPGSHIQPIPPPKLRVCRRIHPSTKGEGLPLWAHCPVPHSLGEKRQVQLTASGGSRTKLGLTEAGEKTVSGWHTA